MTTATRTDTPGVVRREPPGWREREFPVKDVATASADLRNWQTRSGPGILDLYKWADWCRELREPAQGIEPDTG